MSKNWAGGSSRKERRAAELEVGMDVRNPASGRWERIVEAAPLDGSPSQMYIALADGSSHLVGSDEKVLTRVARRARED